MFGLGIQELIIIFIIALLIFGPKKLPELGKALGRGIAEFRKASDELRDGITSQIKLEEEQEAPQPPTAQAQPKVEQAPSPEVKATDQGSSLPAPEVRADQPAPSQAKEPHHG